MGRRGRAALALAAGALALVGATRSASANCASGHDYGTEVEGSSVRICPWHNLGADVSKRACPDPVGTGMLRQNVETGEVVLLAEYCSSEPFDSGGSPGSCYLDQCVPPGAYRYGFTTPWEDPVCGGCPPSQYFREVTVADELAAECVRSEGNEGAELYSGVVPWGDDPDICKDGGFGCSLSAQPRQLVFGIQALCGLLGLGLLLRRRRARRG